MSDGYYINSLRAWKVELQKRHRNLMACHASLERLGHPDKESQGKLIDLNKYLLELLDDKIQKATAVKR